MMGCGCFQVVILFFCFFTTLGESMEFMLLSILSAAVKCQWELSDSEEALITSMVFVGYFIGSLFWGVVFQFIGRKTGLILVCLIGKTFSILSAIPVSSGDDKIPGYPWLLVCRFFIGIAAGGGAQIYPYFLELLLSKCRGLLVAFTFGVIWSVGLRHWQLRCWGRGTWGGTGSLD